MFSGEPGSESVLEASLLLGISDQYVSAEKLMKLEPFQDRCNPQ
jgi:hypothetical protein